ncbi:MAG: family 16 glycosylhydrolase [Saprospiraceae bacterium]|nr:family 16 glycosylhydrolase [Saprospiraceae bacterium]
MKKYLVLLFLISFMACDLNNELPEDNILQAPKISVTGGTIVEGDENVFFNFQVELSWAYNQIVSVDYQTVAETAQEGLDYLAATGTLVFAAGETVKDIPVEIVGENILEVEESFKIELSNPVNGGLLVFAAQGFIQNDDDASDLVIPTSGYSTPTSYDGMSLVWSDEFNGDALNMDDWSFEMGRGNNGWGNNELQYYREENTTVEDGFLVIEAKEENYNGADYTSSRLITQGKQSFRFGRIDIRAVLPEGQGLWPALWMLGTKFNAVGWPACGEIDIMELVGNQPDRVHGTVHYGTNASTRQQDGASRALSSGAKFSEEFHVFSLVWENDKIQWLLNDVVYHEFTRAEVGGFPYPFNDNFFAIFNVAVGGDWPGSPNSSTVFPQRMIVDYIRYFR